MVSEEFHRYNGGGSGGTVIFYIVEVVMIKFVQQCYHRDGYSRGVGGGGYNVSGGVTCK